MKLVWQSVLLLVLGFIGGGVAMNVPMLRSREVTPLLRAGTVQAGRFELAFSPDKPQAYWGLDAQ
jgi:hypothetical protein